MNWLLLHGVLFPIITALPLLTVLVVGTIAQREAAAAGRCRVFALRQAVPLLKATLLSWAGIGIWFLLDQAAIAAGERTKWIGGAEIGAFSLLFIAFSLPLLGSIEEAARRSVQEQITEDDYRFRAASLSPRRLCDYLPTTIHVVPALVSGFLLVSLVLKALEPNPEVRWFLPIGYGTVAVVFFLLYEVWLRSEALGPQALSASVSTDAAPSATSVSSGQQSLHEIDTVARRQKVRTIFTCQSILTISFSVLAVLAAGTRWQNPDSGATAAALGAASAIVGVWGCALALSSSLQERSLRLVLRNR